MVITYLERIECVEVEGKWYSISRVILCISESLSTQKQMILNVSELLSWQRRHEIRVLATSSRSRMTRLVLGRAGEAGTEPLVMPLLKP